MAMFALVAVHTVDYIMEEEPLAWGAWIFIGGSKYVYHLPHRVRHYL